MQKLRHRWCLTVSAETRNECEILVQNSLCTFYPDYVLGATRGKGKDYSVLPCKFRVLLDDSSSRRHRTGLMLFLYTSQVIRLCSLTHLLSHLYFQTRLPPYLCHITQLPSASLRYHVRAIATRQKTPFYHHYFAIAEPQCWCHCRAIFQSQTKYPTTNTLSFRPTQPRPIFPTNRPRCARDPEIEENDVRNAWAAASLLLI